MAKRTQKAGDGERAARILDAADALFGEVGFDGVSVRDLAERADVNKALVFYYYGSKEALFERVMERYYAAHTVALAGAFEAGGTLRERFHRVVDAYVDFIDGHRNWPRLVQRQVAGSADSMPLIQRSLAPLFEWTEHILAKVAPVEGPLAARHFFVTFSGAVINYFTYGPVLEPWWSGDPGSPEAVTERRAHLHWLVDLVLDGLERARDVARDVAQGKPAA